MPSEEDPANFNKGGSSQTIPLAVDLDGTLIFTDMLHELAVKMLTDKPFKLLYLPAQLLKGKARLKAFIAEQIEFSASELPYNEDLIAWLKTEKSSGRHIVLCTAADVAVAAPIKNHVGVFDALMASDGNTNLSGRSKARELVERFGEGKFDYCGNAEIDLSVWTSSRAAVVVNAKDSVIRRAQQTVPIAKLFARPKLTWNILSEVLHLWGWLKNILLFFPALILFLLDSSYAANIFFVSLVGYVLLCCLPIVKDLLTLHADRRSANPKLKPLAVGKISILFVVGFLIAVSTLLFLLLTIYLMSEGF